jgi:death-on-curing protein
MTHRTRTVNRNRGYITHMTNRDGADSSTPLDDVMEDIRRELVRRVAASDRDANRDIYDALEN